MGWYCGGQFLQQAQPLLAINALPFAERDMILQNTAAQREARAQFDTSRLLDLSEQVLLDCPAAQVQWFTSSPFQSQCFPTIFLVLILFPFWNPSSPRSKPFSFKCLTWQYTWSADIFFHYLLGWSFLSNWLQVTPLVREPGRLVLTQARVYFQVTYAGRYCNKQVGLK